MLKIIAGEFRSRKLLGPDDDSVSRPYSARAREAVFNLLRGWFDGTTVLDLFAGVGTVGLEAVSRGAQRVYLVERHRDIFETLRQNIGALNCGERAIAINADALGPAALAQVEKPVEVVFVDPPYEMMEEPRQRQRVLDQIADCRPLMGEKGFVVLRSPLPPTEVDLRIAGFDGPEVHRYGQDMYVLLYAPAQQTSATG